MLLMQDRKQTRVILSAVTSFAPDKVVNYAMNQFSHSIYMTIGSVVLHLEYDSKELRDKDIELLVRGIL